MREGGVIIDLCLTSVSTLLGGAAALALTLAFAALATLTLALAGRGGDLSTIRAGDLVQNEVGIWTKIILMKKIFFGYILMKCV